MPLEKYEKMLREIKEHCENHTCNNCEVVSICNIMNSSFPMDFDFDDEDEDEETYEDYLYEQYKESKI